MKTELMKQLDKHTVWLLPFSPHILPFNSFGLLKQTQAGLETPERAVLVI